MRADSVLEVDVRAEKGAAHLHLTGVVQLGALFWDSLPYPEPYNPQQARETMVAAFRSGTVAVLLVKQPDGSDRLAGFAAAIVAPLLCAEAKLAYEVAFYVSPDWRGHGMKLLLCLERLARQQGCRYMSMVAFANDKAAPAIYRRRGYEHVESTYRKELTQWES